MELVQLGFRAGDSPATLEMSGYRYLQGSIDSLTLSM